MKNRNLGQHPPLPNSNSPIATPISKRNRRKPRRNHRIGSARSDGFYLGTEREGFGRQGEPARGRDQDNLTRPATAGFQTHLAIPDGRCAEEGGDLIRRPCRAVPGEEEGDAESQVVDAGTEWGGGDRNTGGKGANRGRGILGSSCLFL